MLLKTAVKPPLYISGERVISVFCVFMTDKMGFEGKFAAAVATINPDKKSGSKQETILSLGQN